MAVLPCGRCCGWGGRQRDGILQAQQDPIPWAELGWAACGQHHAGLRALPLPGAEQPWPGSASSACKPSQQAGSISESCKQGEKQPLRPSRHAQDVGHIPEAPVASKSWSPQVRWVAASIQPLRGLVCGLLLLGALGSQLLQNFLGYFRWRDCH